MIVKKDGRRESFDRNKIIAGMRRACEKRPVPIVEIERFVDSLEQRLQESGEKEMDASRIGSAVMEAVANDEFLAHVRDTGERLRTRLEQFIGNYPDLFELVRGKGMMLGIRMKVESRPFFVHLRDNHQLLTVAAGDNTLRVLPPLVIGDAEIEEFFEKLSAGAASYTIPES